MPKEVYNIDQFEGGMNNHTHEKDLEPNELALVQNMCVAHKGSIESAYIEKVATSSVGVTPDLIGLPKNKQLFVYNTDFNYTSGFNEGEFTFLLSTDGEKLYRYEGTSWVEKLDLGASISSAFPSLIIYDGQVRFSDGTFVLDSNSQINNTTKLFSVVRRKYFNASTETRFEISQDSAIKKPSGGKIGFDTTVNTTDSNDKGYLGLQIDKSINTVLENNGFVSGSTVTHFHQVAVNSVFKSNYKDIIGSTDTSIATSGIAVIDFYGNTFSLSQINEGSTYTPTTDFEISSSNNSLRLMFNNNSSYFYIPITIGPKFIGNSRGAGSVNVFEIELIGDIYVSQNNGETYSNVTSYNSWNELTWSVIGLNDDGSHASTYSVSIDYNSSSVTRLGFTGSDSHSKYLLKIASTNTDWYKVRVNLVKIMKHVRGVEANGYFLEIAMPSYNVGTVALNSLLNPTFLSLENLISFNIAIAENATYNSIAIHLAEEALSSGSDMFGSNPYFTYTLGADWVNANQGRGWVNVVFSMDQLIATGNPILSSCNNVGFTFNGSASGNNYILINNVDIIEDNRGSWDGYYKFFYSWIYDRVQESGFFEFANQGDGFLLNNHRITSKNIIQELSAGGFKDGARRITGANVYYAEYNTVTKALKYDDPFLLNKINFETGVEKAGGQLTEVWIDETINSETHKTHALFEFIDPPTTSTFSVTAGYDYLPSETIEQIRFKTGASLNRRMYYGNVDLTYENVTGQTHPLRERYSDRIYKSLIDQPDIVPSYNYVDVAINDGDSITAMATYADRLLVYKKNTMYLINATKEIEYIEDIFQFKGVWSSSAVCQSDRGILWANENGCFHYDGEKVDDLTNKKLNQANWSINIGNEPTILFEPKERHVLVLGQGTTHGWLVDLDTNAWSYLNSIKTIDSTNAVIYNGEIIYGTKDSYTQSGGSGGGGAGGGGGGG